MGKTLTIRIPDEMRAQLESISRCENLPLSDLVRESIRGFVVSRRFQRLRDQIVPHAEKQGLVTDEDVFGALS